ncbi:MAG: hypothetical protein FVQ82_06440 [Planctomycetes bacterium]|nr:hypothetical protein [Planctomycetota bacterium]
MSVEQCKDKLIDKQAIKHLAILLAIALVIGIYLIITTVLISKDGVFYIERAQQFMSDPIGIIKNHPPGYPFLILVTHKCASVLSDDSSVFIWIYSAQSVTLLCRLLALVPLYFMGKLLVGSKNSFSALLILIFLPFPSKTVCDVVREWPYLLFLSTGFFFLLWTAISRKWWLFGLVGLSCGLGYWIRSESLQILVYGFLWGGLGLLRPKLWGLSRWKVIAAVGLLLLGFTMSASPYMRCLGRIVPHRVIRTMRIFSFNELSDKTDSQIANANGLCSNSAGIISGNVLKALGEIFKKIGETMMWFFVPFLFIGLWAYFRQGVRYEYSVLVTAFILVNLAMIVLRYCYIQPLVSQRWTLPLVVVIVFYVPVGLQIVGNWLNNKCNQDKEKAVITEDKRFSWFVILFLVGVGICIPKLLRPVGIDKSGYKDTAKWLRDNTGKKEVVVVPDKRIAFYADRKRLRMENSNNSMGGYYRVELVEGDQESGEVSYWVNQRRKKKKVVVSRGSEM